MSLQNVGNHLQNYTLLQPIRLHSGSCRWTEIGCVGRIYWKYCSMCTYHVIYIISSTFWSWNYFFPARFPCHQGDCPDDGHSKHLWNLSQSLPDYTLHNPREPEISYLYLFYFLSAGDSGSTRTSFNRSTATARNITAVSQHGHDTCRYTRGRQLNRIRMSCSYGEYWALATRVTALARKFEL
jgi:hypothetical protein